MAYLIVADVADHTVRKPLGFLDLRDAKAFLFDMGREAVDDGFSCEFGHGDVITIRDPESGESELYRIVESSDPKVLRMCEAPSLPRTKPAALP